MGPDIAYLNGDLQPLAQTRISPLDYGFLYGYGLFETMRAYGGRVFLLDTHLERLYHSAEALEFPPIPSAGELSGAVTQVLAANGLKEARIRLTVSLGEGDMVPNPATCKNPSVLVTARQYTPISRETYARGYSTILSTVRRDSASVLSRLKTCNYLGGLLARQEARRAGADEAVVLNEKGMLAECSASNLFLVTDDLLYTPTVESGLLPGITRQTVVEIAGQLGIAVKVEELSPEALEKADEAFVTNSIMEIMPLTSYEGALVGEGKPGPVTLRLMAAYSRLVATGSTGLHACER
ncbi:MAG: aminotransferase class IV [Chloroflexi bacterium]|nr:aminotransferase class IV [Chloroflexota bacterium]